MAVRVRAARVRGRAAAGENRPLSYVSNPNRAGGAVWGGGSV